MRRAAQLAFGLALVICARTADAQIVNVLSKIKDEEGFSAEAGVTFAFKSGNTNLVQLKSDLGMGYRIGDHLIYLYGTAQFGTKQPIDKLSWESFDKDFVHISNIFGHLRYRYTILDWLDAEAFAQNKADRFQDLDMRLVFGGGPRVHFEPIEGLELAVGTAYMVEHERYNESLLNAVTSHRWSNYVQASYEITDTLTVANTTFVQPRIAGDEPVWEIGPRRGSVLNGVESDSFPSPVVEGLTEEDRTVVSHLRISSESALKIQVSTYFKIELAVTLSYNSNTPPQLDDLDFVECDNTCTGYRIDSIATGFDKDVKPLDVSFSTKFVLSI